MKKLFIHHPLFRLLSPVFSGVIVYLLILLVNNNVEQLQDQFLGQELYLFIGLSFVIQELSRILLWAFKKVPEMLSPFLTLIVQVTSSMILCVIIVTLSIQLYFKNILNYTPNSEELWLFNSIFCVITFIYILLHISHQYLYKVNTQKLNNERLRKQIIEDDFLQFKKGINPDLLFESFEALIVLTHQKTDQVDDLIDQLAHVYRYILSRKKRQLVLINEELSALDALLQLFNYLPYRKVSIHQKLNSGFLMVPGSLLAVAEYIIRITITNLDTPLVLHLVETNDALQLEYQHNDKIANGFTLQALNDLQQVYNIYSTNKVTVSEDQELRTISIPKLIIKPEL